MPMTEFVAHATMRAKSFAGLITYSIAEAPAFHVACSAAVANAPDCRPSVTRMAAASGSSRIPRANGVIVAFAAVPDALA